jgi:TolA-binding protein
MKRGIGWLWCVGIVVSGSWCAGQEVPQDALVQINAATNLQNDLKFDRARDLWIQLIEKYPRTDGTRSWQFNLAICHEKTGNQLAAISGFEKVLADVPADFARTAEAWLHLGFNQWKQAQRLEGKSDQAKEAKDWAASAVASLQTSLQKFPESEFADDALYFLGEANVTAGLSDKAIDAFDRLIVEHPQSELWPEAVYALGFCHEDRGDYDKALVNYERFLEKSPQSPQANEVRFRLAESTRQLGIAADKSGDRSGAQKRFDAASLLYAELAQAAGFEQAALAAFQRADILDRLGQSAEAAAAFARCAADFPQADTALPALVAAGQCQYKAKDFAAAEKHLAAALERDPKSIAAARWLANALLGLQRPHEAWKIADEVLARNDAQSDDAVPLLLARGDAAFAIPDKVVESIDLYRDIAARFPQHPSAPQALYNAIFSCLSARQLPRAIELAESFYKAYPNDTFLADVREVHAEASSQQQQWEAAERMYRILTGEHGQSKKLPSWQIGLTRVLVLGGKTDEAIQFASPLVENHTGASQAELLFWLGTAQFQAKQFEPALTSLNRALQADPKSSLADQVALLAARATRHLGDPAKSITQLEQALQNFPQSEHRDQMLLRLAEFQFDAGQFAPSVRTYTRVIDEFPTSDALPLALYGRGWAELKDNHPKEAVASFDQLIEKFPDHALAKDATLARGMSRRRGGSHEAAAADLDLFLSTNPPLAEKLEAMYERALIDVDAKKFAQAIQRFQELVGLANEPAERAKWGDKFLYELAWAHKESQAIPQANEQFRALVEQFPNSPLSPEAHFHLGESSYESGEFDPAIKQYAAARQHAACPLDVAEKAAYKLGWAHYKKKDYAEAEKVFRQQIADFPQGLLKADGLFMVSECLFRRKEHVAAVTAYKAALPEVRDSANVRDDVKLLTRLHGAQSANEAKQFDDAVEFLKPLVADEPTPGGYAAEAWYEYGAALKGQRKSEEAIAAWTKAAATFDKTGIRARCMIGETLFEDKKFDEAIKQFTLAVYGYGGRDSADSVKPWQAFASYELARCHLVQIQAASADDRAQMVQEARNWFTYLVEHYPSDKLAAEARTQLAKLEKM